MGLMDLLFISFKRFIVLIGGIFLLLLAGTLALSFVPRYIAYTIWYITPIICAVIALIGLAMVAYAVLIKD